MYGGRRAFCTHVVASLARKRSLMTPGPAGIQPSFWSRSQPVQSCWPPVPTSSEPQADRKKKKKKKGVPKETATEPSGSALLFFLFLDVVAARVGTFFHRKFPLHQLFTLSPPIRRLFRIGEPNQARKGPSQLPGVQSARVSPRGRTVGGTVPTLAGPCLIHSAPLGSHR